MQDQLDAVKEVISIFLKDQKEGKRQLIEWFLNDVMDEEPRVQLASMPYERTEERKGHRNGSRTRKLKTVDGELELRKPQMREFPFRTAVFDRYSRRGMLFIFFISLIIRTALLRGMISSGLVKKYSLEKLHVVEDANGSMSELERTRKQKDILDALEKVSWW